MAVQTVTQNFCPTQRIILELAPPKEKPYVMQELTTTQKVTKVAALLLVALGIALLVAGTAFFGAGAFGGVATLVLAESIFPLGLISVLSGSHLLSSLQEGSPPKVSSNAKFGPFSVSL